MFSYQPSESVDDHEEELRKTNLRWRIHEIEFEQVLDAERLEKEDGVGEISPLNLRNRIRK